MPGGGRLSDMPLLISLQQFINLPTSSNLPPGGELSENHDDVSLICSEGPDVQSPARVSFLHTCVYHFDLVNYTISELYTQHCTVTVQM